MNLDCPGCHSRLKLDPAKLPAGATTAICPKCRARILLPGTAPTGTITLKCSHCNARLKVNVARLKPEVSRSKCPKCAKPVSLPAAPPGEAAGAMTRRLDPRDLGIVLGGGEGSARDPAPATDDGPSGSPISVDRSVSESSLDLSRLIDEKVEGLGTQTVPSAATPAAASEPAPPHLPAHAAASEMPPLTTDEPVPFEEPCQEPSLSPEPIPFETTSAPPEPISIDAPPERRVEAPSPPPGLAPESPEPIPFEEPSEEYAEMPLVMPATPPAEEKPAGAAEEPSGAPGPPLSSPPPAASRASLRAESRPTPASSSSRSETSRPSSGAGRTDRAGPSFGRAAAPPSGGGAVLPLLLGGIGGGALLGGVASVLVWTGWLPAEMLPALPEPISAMLGPNLGGVILAAILTTVGVLLGGTVQPATGSGGRRSPVSILGCVLGAALMGLLGGIILTLIGSGGLPLWPALAGAVELGLAGLLAGGVGRLLAGRS